MRSKQKQQINRGYLIEGEESKYFCLSFDEKIKLLQSKIPIDRTLGARLLANSKENKAIEYLINALKIEKKLYSKIEICNALVSYGQLSVKLLTEIFGKAGTNQHTRVPEKEFKKESYPLPRDISSRTLANIGKNALPELVKILESKNEKQLSEAIDAIGFICFYAYTPKIFGKLKGCYIKNCKNELIKWKIIRSMSGFPESQLFLKEQKQKIQNVRLCKEIDRSLFLIKKKTGQKTNNEIKSSQT